LESYFTTIAVARSTMDLPGADFDGTD